MILPNLNELYNLSKLKISCNYYDNGCNEVFEINYINDLKEHQKRCIYFERCNIIHKEKVLKFEENGLFCKRCKIFDYNPHDCINYTKFDHINAYSNLEMKSQSSHSG